MLNLAKSLPEDPEDLRRFTALLLAEMKSQALLIKKLRHQLAGHRNHRFGASSETIEQLQLALEASEIAIAKMTAKLQPTDEEPDEEKATPKRRPIPDHIPRMEVELTTGDDDCAQCGGALRRLGEDVTEELEYLPGRFSAPASFGLASPVPAAKASHRRRCHPARSSGGVPARACWPMSWSINTPITSRSIAKARSSSVTGCTWTARRWRTGSANRRRFWSRPADGSKG
jgi:hypothetical protein